jgi:hypothetical protein
MIGKSKKSIYTGHWIGANQEYTSESVLWRHVVCQAISDLYLGDNRKKANIIYWIKTKDYEICCEFACLNHENLKYYLKEIILGSPQEARILGETLKRTIKTFY